MLFGNYDLSLQSWLFFKNEKRLFWESNEKVEGCAKAFNNILIGTK